MPIEGLIIVAALAQPSGQTLSMKREHIIHNVQRDASTWAIESLKELDSLLNDSEIPGVLRPTYYSYSNARKRLVETSALLNDRPELILDGEGGIDIEWEVDGRQLMYACRGDSSQRDYIYFQSGRTYGGRDYSAIYSTDRLNWLLKG